MRLINSIKESEFKKTAVYAEVFFIAHEVTL